MTGDTITTAPKVSVELHRVVYMGDHSEYVTEVHDYDPSETVETLAERLLPNPGHQDNATVAYLVIRPIVPVYPKGVVPW